MAGFDNCCSDIGLNNNWDCYKYFLVDSYNNMIGRYQYAGDNVVVLLHLACKLYKGLDIVNHNLDNNYNLQEGYIELDLGKSLVFEVDNCC
jgi:hypothetical protein